MAKKKMTHQYNTNSTDHHNPQQPRNSDNHNHSKPHNNGASMDDPYEKLSSLKSLNDMLLKEIVNKRQQVNSILESIKSLESEITRSSFEIEALKSELTQIKDEKLGVDIEKGVVCAFLESQVGDMRKIAGEFENVIHERDNALKALDEERISGSDLKVKVSDLTKKVDETAKELEDMKIADADLIKSKEELESKYMTLAEEKGLIEKRFSDGQREISECKAKMQSKEAILEQALTMLRTNAVKFSQVNAKMEEDCNLVINKRSKDGDVEPCMMELEAIGSTFNNHDAKFEEMKDQLEALQVSVVEANKRKSFWILVSSATTIIAALMSFAYATKVR